MIDIRGLITGFIFAVITIALISLFPKQQGLILAAIVLGCIGAVYLGFAIGGEIDGTDRPGGICHFYLCHVVGRHVVQSLFSRGRIFCSRLLGYNTSFKVQDR